MIRSLRNLLGLPSLAMLVCACSPQAENGQTASESAGEIINISGDLYQARTGTRNTVFLVTAEGIVLCDPINTDFARWLKFELSERFDVPVTYVIYSHHHPDHVSGGIVFADTASFVAHEAVTAALNAPLPSNAATLDLDGDGRLAQAEATALAYDRDFDRYDRNGDGSITGAEINAETPLPDLVYSDRMTIELGGSRIELMHPGPAHSDDMTVVRFPDQRAVFGVDFMHVKRFPATLGGHSVAQYAEAVARVEALDFDIVIPGHGDVGEKADLALFLEFLRALDAAVSSGIAAGQSLAQMRASLDFPAYREWLLYETRRVTLITETYELLTRP